VYLCQSGMADRAVAAAASQPASQPASQSCSQLDRRSGMHITAQARRNWCVFKSIRGRQDRGPRNKGGTSINITGSARPHSSCNQASRALYEGCSSAPPYQIPCLLWYLPRRAWHLLMRRVRYLPATAPQ
jgi:hypothetical protein